jgi:protein TonB
MKFKLLVIITLLFCLDIQSQQKGSVDSIKITKFESQKDSIYNYVEKMPEFPGGSDSLMIFLRKNIVYPTIAKENGVSGKTIVFFVIDIDGSVTQQKIIRSVDSTLDIEVIRFISSMPKWIPGEHNGKKVKVKMSLPINIHFE